MGLPKEGPHLIYTPFLWKGEGPKGGGWFRTGGIIENNWRKTK